MGDYRKHSLAHLRHTHNGAKINGVKINGVSHYL
jgi:hypothetical protein